jgi:hypothetical protein
MTDRKTYIKRIADGQAIKGKVLHVDKTRDLALVRLDKVPADTAALPLARSSIKVGEDVITIGNPGAVDWAFSTTQNKVLKVGPVEMIVNGGNEALRIKAMMLTLSNPIGRVDWGGPVIDRRGFQVGVTESGRVGIQNALNAIDVTEVHALLKENKITLRLPPEPVTPRRIPPPPERTDEQVAADMLKRARLFADDADTRPLYVTRLKRLVEKYPDTPAGKEARKLLDNMK